MYNNKYIVVWGHDKKYELHVKLFAVLADAQEFAKTLYNDNYDLHNGELPFNIQIGVFLGHDYIYSEES